MQEVEAVCSRVVIINKGKLVADGSIPEIKQGALVQAQRVVVQFDLPVTENQLEALEGVTSARLDGDRWEITSGSTADIRPEIFRFAVENNLTLLTLLQKQENLEGIFHQLTRGKDIII